MNFVKYNYSSNPIDEASSACIALKTNQVQTLRVYQILSCSVQQKNITPIPFPLSFIYKDVSKSSRTVLVKRSLLTLDVKFLRHLQSTPLLHEYSGPSISAMLESIPGSPFLELCQVPAAISLESLQWCRIFHPSSEAPAWGRGKSHREPDRVSMGMGDHCQAVLGQKLRNFKGPVSRGMVVVDNELLVLPFLWPLAPHIFT